MAPLPANPAFPPPTSMEAFSSSVIALITSSMLLALSFGTFVWANSTNVQTKDATQIIRILKNFMILSQLCYYLYKVIHLFLYNKVLSLGYRYFIFTITYINSQKNVICLLILIFL